jgi:tRNA A-37 threonylcarbamoyl transferase component Bud32
VDTDQIFAPSGEAPPLLKIGEDLGGRFDILKTLGSGGMARVYLARDRVLGRELALKVYPKSGLKAAAIERIRREVGVARDLQHPGLVQYYDLHETDDVLALSMEHVPGHTLQARIMGEDRLREEDLLPIVTALAGAMEHLHAHGIIHRDVKPSNIFLCPNGGVKLGDFGIIRVEGEEGLTRTGETVGTPTHMSPEQFQGLELTTASDYYSLGVTLYEALTGAPPFTGTYGELAVQHMNHAPPAIPGHAATRRMRRLVEGLLLKDPGRRWGKPELDRFLHSGRLPFLPRQKKSAALLSAALVLAALSPIAWGRYHHPEPTSIQTHPPRVAAYRGDRLLWEKNIPGLTDAILADTNGDGLKEVVVGKALELQERRGSVRLDAWTRDGSPAAPVQLDKSFTHYFRGFAPQYQTFFAPVDFRRFAVFLYNPNFYPTCAYIWDAPSRKVVFSSVHSGRFYGAVPFGKGVAMEGINNRLLHQKVVLVTQDLAAATSLSYNAVDDINYLYGKGARAYFLLGSEGKIRLEGPDSVLVRVSGEPEHRLRPDASFEGMASGAASLSLEYIEAYRQIRDLLMQGGAAQAIPRLDKLLDGSERALYTAIRSCSPRSKRKRFCAWTKVMKRRKQPWPGRTNIRVMGWICSSRRPWDFY